MIGMNMVHTNMKEMNNKDSDHKKISKMTYNREKEIFEQNVLHEIDSKMKESKGCNQDLLFIYIFNLMFIHVTSETVVVCIPGKNGYHDPPFQMINNVTGEVTGYYMDVTKKIA